MVAYRVGYLLYTFDGNVYPSLGSGLETVFKTFEEFTTELLLKVPQSRRRTLAAKLKASGPMGSRVHAYLEEHLLKMAIYYHKHDERIPTEGSAYYYAEESACAHPSFPVMIQQIQARYREGWELFRVEGIW